MASLNILDVLKSLKHHSNINFYDILNFGEKTWFLEFFAKIGFLSQNEVFSPKFKISQKLIFEWFFSDFWCKRHLKCSEKPFLKKFWPFGQFRPLPATLKICQNSGKSENFDFFEIHQIGRKWPEIWNLAENESIGPKKTCFHQFTMKYVSLVDFSNFWKKSYFGPFKIGPKIRKITKWPIFQKRIVRMRSFIFLKMDPHGPHQAPNNVELHPTPICLYRPFNFSKNGLKTGKIAFWRVVLREEFLQSEKFFHRKVDILSFPTHFRT